MHTFSHFGWRVRLAPCETQWNATCLIPCWQVSPWIPQKKIKKTQVLMPYGGPWLTDVLQAFIVRCWNTAMLFALLMRLAQLKELQLIKLSSIPCMHSTCNDYPYVEHLSLSEKWSMPHIDSPSPGVLTWIQTNQHTPDVLDDSKSLIINHGFINPQTAVFFGSV